MAILAPWRLARRTYPQSRAARWETPYASKGFRSAGRGGRRTKSPSSKGSITTTPRARAWARARRSASACRVTADNERPLTDSRQRTSGLQDC